MIIVCHWASYRERQNPVTWESLWQYQMVPRGAMLATMWHMGCTGMVKCGPPWAPPDPCQVFRISPISDTTSIKYRGKSTLQFPNTSQQRKAHPGTVCMGVGGRELKHWQATCATALTYWGSISTLSILAQLLWDLIKKYREKSLKKWPGGSKLINDEFVRWTIPWWTEILQNEI